MICELVRRLLPLHAGDDLPALARRLVDRHVARCGACTSELARFGEARRGLVELSARESAHRSEGGRGGGPDPLGDNFWFAIRRDLRAEGLVRRPGQREEHPAHARARRSGSVRRAARRGLAVRALAAAFAVVAAALVYGVPGIRGARDVPPGLVEERPVERIVAASTPGHVPVAIPVLAASVSGWLEETQAFEPAEVEFGIERWSHEHASEMPRPAASSLGPQAPENGKKEEEPESLSF